MNSWKSDNEAMPAPVTPEPFRPDTESPVPVESGIGSLWAGQLPREAAREWRWGFWQGLPGLNQALLLAAAACMGLACLLLVGPLVKSGIQTAAYPYTAAGRQETCLSNLQQIQQAIAQYSADYDGHYPPLHSGGESGSGIGSTSWVSLLNSKVDKRYFQCPSGQTGVANSSSYGLNPVLSLALPEEDTGSGESAGTAAGAALADPASVILLADRWLGPAVSGTEVTHLLPKRAAALSPPLPGWASPATGTEDESGEHPAHLDFRHSQAAAVLFADGHAAAQPRGEWVTAPSTWGGALALRRSADRLRGRYPLLQQVDLALASGQDKQARQLLLASPKQAQAAGQELLALWKLNSGGGQDDASSESLEKWSWQIGDLLSHSDQPAVWEAMVKEQSRRSQAQLQQVNDGEWQSYESDLGFSLEYPAGWTVETETQGRYRRTYFRSGSPYISVLVEKGERTRPGPQSGIDWEGLERTFKRDSRSYRRVVMGLGWLAGEEASQWRFDLQRADGPELHKWYLGRSHTWDSMVVACVAPEADYAGWQPVFERMVRSFGYRYG